MSTPVKRCFTCDREHGPEMPDINLNGTDGRELRGQVLQVTEALKQAVNAIQDAWPNGRDYPYSDYSRAAAQWSGRLEMLKRVQGEMREIYSHIEAQVELREARKR